MGFNLLIFGFFFVFFDFNLGPVNILPNIIGYLSIYFGAEKAASMIPNQHFFIIKKTSGLLIILSGLDMIIKYSSVLNNALYNPASVEGKVFILVFYIVQAALLIYLFYHLSKGIGLAAEKLVDQTLSAKASRVYRLFLAYQLLISTFFLGGLLVTERQQMSYSFDSGIGVIIVIIGFILVIHLFIQLWSLLRQAERELAN